MSCQYACGGRIPGRYNSYNNTVLHTPSYLFFWRGTALGLVGHTRLDLKFEPGLLLEMCPMRNVRLGDEEARPHRSDNLYCVDYIIKSVFCSGLEIKVGPCRCIRYCVVQGPSCS